GSRYWLRRRRPAFERGVDMRSSLGLPDAYCDVFDRIESRGAAWLVAAGHVLLHAFDPPQKGDAAAAAAASDSSSSSMLCNDGQGAGGRRATSGEGCDGNRDEDEERREEQYRRLLENCLEPSWYEKKSEKTAATAVIEAVGGKAIPALTAALTRLANSSASATSSLLSSTRSAKNKSIGQASSLAVTVVSQAGSPDNNLQEQPRPSSTPTSPQTMTPLSLHSSPGTGRRRRSRSPSRRSHRQGGNRTGTRSPEKTRLQATTAVGPGGKTCAVCLRRSSPAAMCPKCGRRAAKALKDREGSRRARVILVPYGGHFGVGEADALQREGDAVKRWVRLLDDETGANFYHNVHYGSSVWKSGIELPKPAPVVKAARRRRKIGDGGGGVAVVGSPKSAASVPGSTTPPASGSPAARALPMERAATSPRAIGMAAPGSSIVDRRALLRKTKTAFSVASMAALRAAAGGTTKGGDNNNGEDDDNKGKNNGDDDDHEDDVNGTSSPRPIIKPAIKKPAAASSPASPSSPQRNASASPTAAAAASPGRNRVVVRDAGDSEPEVVLDAHRRIYPPFRLVSWEDVEAAAAAESAGLKGVSPRPGTGVSGRKSHSRGTPGDSAGSGRRPRLTTAVTKGGR
ncbi:unnamed protein product, partial [Ectocarpus fasciculatus]